MINPNHDDRERAVTAAVNKASIKTQNPIARGDIVKTIVSPIERVIIRNNVVIICKIRN